ncbi:hypothetical protein [Maridesulfovibrio frigidus]|uniref:hypothetical protein n=1 Tax=Maridesulfovibrio frigidus TaxID=340956 RepID=UPI000A5718CE|nr:hypothetical protein [Maridesulfovibrio frigidus]
MKHIEFTAKQLAVATSSGLSEEELFRQLTGDGVIPPELLDVAERIAEQTADTLEDDES